MLLLSLSNGPPQLFVEGHAGGRCYAMRYVRGAYREQECVFAGIEEPADTTFSPGPAMRYARVDRQGIRVYHRGRFLGAWRVPGARILSWWNLPVVVRAHRVYLLRPGGRVRCLPLNDQFLKTALPGRSGSLFALYATQSHWRVLRRSKGGDRWTSWLPGPAVDFAPTPLRLFVAVGQPADHYRTYGAIGPGALWSYDYRNGGLVRHRTLPGLTELVFDSPWVRADHLTSVMTYPPEPLRATHWFPSGTELLGLSHSVRTITTVPDGWEIHAFEPRKRRLLGLHMDRKNMGYDLRWLHSATGAQSFVEDMVDAVDVSTEPGYSPTVEG